MEDEPIERERPNRNNVRKGDLVFVINWDNEVVSAEVNSVRSSEVGVKYERGFVDVIEVVPYSRIAFRGAYGSFVMGITIERRLFPEAA